MKRTPWTTGALATAALSTLVVAGSPVPAGAEDTPDPGVVATREANAMTTLPAGYTAPRDVQVTDPHFSGSTRVADLYLLDGLSTSGGYIRATARDNPAQDSPGRLTTTMRIYGNAAAFRDGSGSVALKSEFTCSGIGISGLTIGSGGVSVSGGSTSSTLTWNTSRGSATNTRQYYTEDGHFRCKASNASPAKTTHRVTGTATYKNVDTRAQDSYSFWW